MSEKKVNLEGKIPLEEVLVKFKERNKEFREEIEKEESFENRNETIDSIHNEIKGVKINTALKTDQFINEIKSGLGEKVRKNPNGVKIIKKKWYQRIGTFIKNIFTKF